MGGGRLDRAVLGDSACWIEGNAMPFGIYEKLYRHQDKLVVIDDVDSLYADKSGIRLLKCLCQTEDEKTVAWHTDARSLEKHGMDWTEVLAVDAENLRARLAADILGSWAYASTGEKVRAFVQQGGGCRATFYSAPRGV